MPGGVEHRDLQTLPGDHLPGAEVILADHLGQPRRDAGKVRVGEQPAVRRMDGGGAAEGRLHRGHPGQVVEVAVGEQDAVGSQPCPAVSTGERNGVI